MWNQLQFQEQSWSSAEFLFPHCETPIVGQAEGVIPLIQPFGEVNLAWPQVFSPMAMGWMARKSASWVAAENTDGLTCCINLGIPRAGVELIRHPISVVIPEASIACSVMVVVHLLRVSNEWAVILKVWNSIVVCIWITVITNTIIVSIQLICIVGIWTIVILVRYSIQVPIEAVITSVACKMGIYMQICFQSPMRLWL